MNDKPRSDHSDRTKAERIERLRERLRVVENSDAAPRGLVNVIKGVLDLLSDEL